MRQIIITWGTRVLLAIAIVLLAVAPTLSQPTSAPAPAQTEEIQEIRGVWLTNVSSAVLYSPWGIERALSQLAELNFNTVYPVAWNRGVTFYPSETAEKAIGRSQDFTLGALRPGKDTLDEMIFIGHQKGLRIIPWFEYGFMAPQNSLIVKRHPSWLAQPRDSIALTHHGKYGLEWLNPLHPEVQKLLIDLIAEVVTRYDVDGIQLDDHFSLPVELGYDPFTTWLYQQEHQGETPPENYENAEWMRWRANKLTQVMQRIHDRIKEIKPDCIISISPNPHQYAYRKYLQDWPTWVNRGLVDEVVVQVYRSSMESFQRDLNLNNALLTQLQQKIPVAIGISSGTVRTPISINLIEEQVKAVRDRGFDGVSFFYWESLWGYITPESPHVRRRGFENLLGEGKS